MNMAVPSLRVLYVEDNPADADLTRWELARQAPEMLLEVVSTRGAALAQLAPANPPFDVVLTDLNLPDGNGLELVAHIRDRGLPLAIVIITGSGDQEEAVAALKAGADDYLVKKTGETGNLHQVLLAAHSGFTTRRARRSRPLRVLYVEPSSYDADLTRSHLAQHAPHIHLDVVRNDEEALKLLGAGDASPYDVLLTDYHLPGTDALELTKAVRQEEGLDIPIVLVTGHGTEDVAVQAMRLGIDDYLVKGAGYLLKLPVILEKMQTQAELNRSEERYRSLYENNHAVMLVVDPEKGVIVDANPAAAAWYGWSREELRGKKISEINTLPTNEILTDIARAGRREEWELFFRHRRADGSVRDVEIFSGPVTIGGRSLLYSIIHDVTEKKRAEEELIYRNMILSTQQEASIDGILVVDENNSFVSCNHRFAEMWGIPARLMEEKEDGLVLKLLTEQVADPRRFLAGVHHLHERNETTSKEEFLLADGRVFEHYAAPMVGEDGHYFGRVWYFRDITGQKKLEAQYLHAQKLESIGTLAGGVAHDFNNILTVIVGLGQMAIMKMAEDDANRSSIGGILEAAERASHLTKQLLLFSRNERSELRPVDLNDVIGAMAKFLHRIIGDDIVLKQAFHSEPLPILADSHHLEQVLMNLAVNARDAMPNGGEFLLRTEPAMLDERFVISHGFGKPGTYASLIVSDSGMGMTKEVQKRIFEPFFTTKAAGKGTGLGLAVVYGIVKQHEGYITVQSEPRRGTTFRIYLPLTDQELQKIGSRHAPPIAGGSETILLAEDDEQVRGLMASVLTEAGYNVLVAVNGKEAIQKFRDYPGSIRLLIFDLIMPEMNGKEASDKIRKLKPEVKTIFCSGYAPDVIREKVYLEDARWLIYKPISPRELLKMARRALDEPR